jgi:hypothetical protein
LPRSFTESSLRARARHHYPHQYVGFLSGCLLGRFTNCLLNGTSRQTATDAYSALKTPWRFKSSPAHRGKRAPKGALSSRRLHKGWDFCSLPVGPSSQNHPLGVGEPAYSAAYLAGDVLAVASHRRRWLAREGNSRRHLSPVAEGAAAPPPGSHSSVRSDRSISLLSELRPKALQGATAAKG